MKSHAVYSLILLPLSAALAVAETPPGDSRTAALAAARELSQQLFMLQNAIATIPGPPKGRALYQECEQVQNYVTTFRRFLKSKVNRAEIVANFDKMDAKLERLLDNINASTEWNAALRGAAGEARAAAHDLQFAIASGDSAPTSMAQSAYRQTLALLQRGENLTTMVRYVFAEQAALKDWNTDLAAFTRAATDLKRLQADHAPSGDVRRQFLATERNWDVVVRRIKALPESQFLLLKRRGAQVDEIIGRLADMYGIHLHRAPLVDPLLMEETGQP